MTPDFSDPTLVMTLEGYPFDPIPNVWRIGAGSETAIFDFDKIVASATTRESLKAAARVWLETRPATACNQDFKSIRVFLRSTAATFPTGGGSEITAERLKGYLASLPRGRTRPAHFARLALLHWGETGSGGFTPGLLDDLARMRIQGSAPGQAVRTCSPTQGALTADQRHGLLDKLWDAASASPKDPSDPCAAILVATFGTRPVQLSWLKVCDLQSARNPEEFVAELHIPRAKQGGGMLPRDEFAVRGLGPEMSELLEVQCGFARGWARDRGLDPKTAPLFPMRWQIGKALPPRAPQLVGHSNSHTLGKRIWRLIKRIDGVPGRVDGELVTAVRLRRTLASVLVEEGWSFEEIAELLDQSGLGSAFYYVQAMAALGDRLDDALGPAYADLVSGFKDGVDPESALSRWEG